MRIRTPRTGVSCRLPAALLGLAALRSMAAAPGAETPAAQAPVARAPAAEAAAGDMDAQAVASFRCSQLSDPLACISALSRKPDDPGLLVSEADALVSRSRPGEAIGVYRHALRAGADPHSMVARIADAESLRRSLLRECAAGSDLAAAAACDAAWLPGAPDEVSLFKRRGRLLLAAGRPADALQAFVAAARLAPHDRNAARAVVDLTASAGAADVALLAARGDALLNLGRPAEAIEPLRQVLQSAPGRTDVRRRLQTAEREAARSALPRKPPAQRQAPSPPASPQPVPQTARLPSVGDKAAAASLPVAEPSNEAPLTRSN